MKINDRQIKEPQSLTYTLTDVESLSFVSSTGLTIRDVVGTPKTTLEISWGALTELELSDILTLINQMRFEVEYLDGVTRVPTKKWFYCKEKSSPVYSYAEGLPTWEGLSATFIEY